MSVWQLKLWLLLCAGLAQAQVITTVAGSDALFPLGGTLALTAPLKQTLGVLVVTFAGLTPGNPGLYQVNAVVPSGIVTGDAVPAVISVAGQTSPVTPAVTMAVK